MARVKRGVASKKSHKNVFSKTKGFRHGRKNLIKLAKQASVRAQKNAYIGRKLKKRNFKSLWILKINAICRMQGTTYSRFIGAMRKSEAKIDRKELAQMAANDQKALEKIIQSVSN
ncbi:MAG: 50S ribosomal protein L20 [candidate division WS2 bacterium ADurb.Bin280]|uniref:Large ribosomal subunit protein bL20 n=1 Tax=candidate division WS2 bacterium ADurb.Bin280 TaxID=1852829 RepID=A0A1V5SFQ8_9BACT|nr:MAG: 50S ribosomal protein L20 [candidate division WS2 bacterium ADurb.Bin280]